LGNTTCGEVQVAEGHLKWKGNNGGLEAVLPVRGPMVKEGMEASSPEAATLVKICYFVTVLIMT